MMYVPTNVVVSRTKHSKTKTEARSTQISKTKHPRFKTKHPNLENEAPKTRKRSTLDRKRSTQISKTKTPKLENEAPESGGGSGCVRSSKGPQNPSQGFIRACQLFNWTFLDRIYCITAVITNARLQRVFPSVQTCVLVDVNQSLPWFFTRWPREDSQVLRLLSTRKNMSAFQPFLQYFAAGSDTASCQDYEEKEFVECFSEETQIIDIFTHFKLQPHKLSQSLWVLASSGFYSITWRMK